MRTTLTEIKENNMSENNMNLNGLTPNEHNPRTVTTENLEKLKESLLEYGDISGVVYNRKTKRLVCGHQRRAALGLKDGESDVDLLNRCEIICKYRDKVDKFGTLGEGVIVSPEGIRLNYREVRWDEAVERVVMLVANNHAGAWDKKKLIDNLQLIQEKLPEVSTEGMMFEQGQMEKLLKGVELSVDVAEFEETSLTSPMTAENVQLLPSQVRMIQLFFNVETQPEFLNICKALQFSLGKENITDTVLEAVKIAQKTINKGIEDETL